MCIFNEVEWCLRILRNHVQWIAPAEATRWSNDKTHVCMELQRSASPLGLGPDELRLRSCCNLSSVKVRSVSSTSSAATVKGSKGLLERVLSSNFCSSSNRAAPQLWARAYVQTGAFKDAVTFQRSCTHWRLVRCRSLNPKSDNADVANIKDINKPGTQGEDSDGLFEKQEQAKMPAALVGATNGTTLYVKSSDKDVDESTTPRVGFWENLPRRYIIVWLCFVAFLLCNMDRVRCCSNSFPSFLHNFLTMTATSFILSLVSSIKYPSSYILSIFGSDHLQVTPIIIYFNLHQNSWFAVHPTTNAPPN